MTQTLFAEEYSSSIDPEALEFAREHSRRMRNPPSTLEIITRQKIDRCGALTLDEVLEKIIGVHVGRASDGSSSQRVVRGINARWLIIV